MALRSSIFRRDLERDGWPTVTVVLPVRNEADHLEQAVKAVLAQEYPVPFTVCLAVAPSDDDTSGVAARLAADHPAVTVTANPAGVTPAGLNAAIAATDSEVVVRVDGHCVLSDGYIRTAVATMSETGAVNVGGVQHPVGTTPFQAAVVTAMTSKLGTGGARFHVGGEPGPVDTVYLGVFDRAAGDAVGWFDDRLIRNQDYELNIRLREAGGTIWFDPRLSAEYVPRSSWSALARQYFEYGYWKAVVVRMHPEATKLRQVAAATLPIATLSAGMLGLTRFRPALAVPAAYVGALLTIGSPSKRPRTNRVRVAAVIATQHFTWSVGFWVGTVRGLLLGRASHNATRGRPT